jgi:Tfp pilus assembly protein PilZ
MKKNQPLSDSAAMKPSSAKDKTSTHVQERRNFSRKVQSGSVFFATQKQLFEGELLNYSQGGLGIRVFEKFVEGENLIVALPFDDATPAKCSARVVWCNGKGFGAKYVR